MIGITIVFFEVWQMQIALKEVDTNNEKEKNFKLIEFTPPQTMPRMIQQTQIRMMLLTLMTAMMLLITGRMIEQTKMQMML